MCHIHPLSGMKKGIPWFFCLYEVGSFYIYADGLVKNPEGNDILTSSSKSSVIFLGKTLGVGRANPLFL